MNENFVSRAAVVAILLWIITAAFVAAVWGLALLDVSDRWTLPFALMACVSCCIAVLTQVRVGMFRLCAVVRATAGIESSSSADVRALR